MSATTPMNAEQFATLRNLREAFESTRDRVLDDALGRSNWPRTSGCSITHISAARNAATGRAIFAIVLADDPARLVAERVITAEEAAEVAAARAAWCDFARPFMPA